MKAYKLTMMAMLLALTTACVYDPYLYSYPARRVVVERQASPNGPVYEYEYAPPVYSAPPAVVVDPFFWLLAPWAIDGYYYGHYGHGGGYHGGYHGGYGGGYHGGGNHGGGGHH